MDESADMISQVPRETADVPAVLFVDDVLLSAKSPEGLQNLLDIVSGWAQDYQMVWNTKPGKVKFYSQPTKQSKIHSRRQALHKSQRNNHPKGCP